jgi:hypothetical protein
MTNRESSFINSIRLGIPFPHVLSRINCPAVSDVIAPSRLGITGVGVGVFVLVVEGWSVFVGERVGVAAKDGVGEMMGISLCELIVKAEFAAESGLHAVHKNMPRTQKKGDGIFIALPPVACEYDGG